uniref:Zinc finger, CCHC-type n=1 Tax=Tanacetum cinerariifolium TaxID=118510 RepID=A0A699HRG8_TANCI|nr:zinc finger, CCHC-type [Tanacetum cinerariifolium]
MAGNTVKEMTTNFGKLDKFEGHDFRRWQKKMHFLLTTLKVVYVLTTSMPELLEDVTVEAIRIRAKWENDDYICRGHILNGMSDSLFDVYTNVESAKELWDSLKSKYMAADSSSKKFLDFKHTLKHGKDDLSLVQLGSHLCIEESLRAQDNDQCKGKEVGGPSVNMTEEGGKKKHHKQNKGKKRSNENNSGPGSNKKPKLECWKCDNTGHFKRDCRSGKKNNENAGAFYVHVDAIAWWIDFVATTHDCKDRCWFKTFEPVKDGSVLYMGMIHETTAPYTPQQNGVAERKNRALKEMVNSMLSYSGLKSRDAIFDENRFSSVPRPKDIIPSSDESQRDDLSDDVPNEIPEPRKEAIDDEIGSIMENNTWVLSDLPPGCKPLGYIWIFKKKMKVDGTIDKFKARLAIQGFRQKEGIGYFDTDAPVARITTIRLLLALAAIHNLVIHQMDVKTAFLNGDLDEEVYMKQPKGFIMPEKLKQNTWKLVDQLEYSRVIGCLMYVMTSTRLDIAYVVGRLSRFTSNASRQHWKAITRVFKYFRDLSSTSGWVFLLGGGAISRASKKQTCITGSTMESKFVALAADGARTKRTTYVNMKFCRFKKLGLGFLYVH